MTALPDVQMFSPDVPGAKRDKRPYLIQETYWGYILRSSARPDMTVLAAQGASWLLGILALAGVGALWFGPSAAAAAELFGFRIGFSTLLTSLGMFLLWFASRGSLAEVQVDTARGEVREVLCNRVGRPTVLGRYGFDAFLDVRLEPVGGHGSAGRRKQGDVVVVLQFRNTSHRIEVVAGSRDDLTSLQDRLAVDLMLRARRDIRGPLQEADTTQAA
jgi:hypothetical protein